MSVQNPTFGKTLYIRIDGKNNAIAGTELWLKKAPSKGRWKALTDPNLCCNPTTTTSTTTTTTSTTTTTTTTLP